MDVMNEISSHYSRTRCRPRHLPGASRSGSGWGRQTLTRKIPPAESRLAYESAPLEAIIADEQSLLLPSLVVSLF
jgi:hypothetical protein